MTKDEMVGWHHWLNGHDFEQTSGDSEGQGSLACCSLWGCRVGHDWLNNNNLKVTVPLVSALSGLWTIYHYPSHFLPSSQAVSIYSAFLQIRKCIPSRQTADMWLFCGPSRERSPSYRLIEPFVRVHCALSTISAPCLAPQRMPHRTYTTAPCSLASNPLRASLRTTLLHRPLPGRMCSLEVAILTAPGG